jgi:hypothetical protein
MDKHVSQLLHYRTYYYYFFIVVKQPKDKVCCVLLTQEESISRATEFSPYPIGRQFLSASQLYTHNQHIHF